MTRLNQSYNEIEASLRHRKPFTHNGSMSASTVMSHCDACGEINESYQVRSYSTPIYVECMGCGDKWINPTKYSMTTTRQQKLVRRVLL